MNFIYAVIIGALLGFIIDLYVCIFSISDGVTLNKGNSLLKLLNTVVYGSGAGLMYLVLLIPFFSRVISIPVFMIIGSLICTGTELGYGIMINILLFKLTKKKLWDYSHSKINFMGQIDLAHAVGWAFLAVAVQVIFKILFD